MASWNLLKISRGEKKSSLSVKLWKKCGKKLRMEQKEGTMGEMCHIFRHLLHETEKENVGGGCKIQANKFAFYILILHQECVDF